MMFVPLSGLFGTFADIAFQTRAPRIAEQSSVFAFLNDH
jgi:hypothetical protein